MRITLLRPSVPRSVRFENRSQVVNTRFRQLRSFRRFRFPFHTPCNARTPTQTDIRATLASQPVYVVTNSMASF